jgi:hypothetical protein
MHPLKLSVLATPALLLASIAGCGSGHSGPDADEALACMTSGRGDMFAVGLSHTGVNAAYKFELRSAMPATPDRADRGTWVIAISWEATGAPVTGASLTVTPFMPDHQHGPGAYTPQIQAMPTPGQYQISDINTWMPGYWEVTIDAMSPDKPPIEDSAVFKVCVNA